LRADAEDGFRDDDGGGGTDGRGEERELDHDASRCTDHKFLSSFLGTGRGRLFRRGGTNDVCRCNEDLLEEEEEWSVMI
jgi:hypothetical protein